ncbi:ABC transporter ATP-binding protein [Aliiglaciecola litoralis]|uniref:ABC transporter domain-containing protein n=1 Tax=Aliiglaciecola litoralis TaxID=582857 RepID=A0ABP3WR23_9ALTE
MLSIEKVRKSYGDKTVLDDISFNVAAGETVALLGANGSGKTTTINSICQLIEFEQGDILFNNTSIRTDRRYLKKVGAVLGGSRNINWRLTACQNAEYFAALRGHSGKQLKQHISALEARLGLKQYHTLEVLKLSTGNKQKAALLSALAYSPNLLLLDEPTLGLDIDTVEELKNIIHQQSTLNGQAFLVTSHDMSFIDKICQKVVVLEQGKVIFNGDIASLKKALYSFKLEVKVPTQLIDNIQQKVEQLCMGRFQQHTRATNLYIEFESPQQVLGLLAWLNEQDIAPEHLTIMPLTMHDAFQTLMQRSKKA